MKICIFPGTFNPIHNAHIQMAEYALNKYRYDKIIFIPAYIPPHKDIENSLAKHRLNMVQLATQNNSRFVVSDIEYNSEDKSYSLITVRKIKELYNIKNKLDFIIGTDAFAKLNTWYKTDELKLEVHFIVFPRFGDDIDKISRYYIANNWDFEITQMDYVNISSTEIRKHITPNNMNDNVKEYIKKNELYEY